MSMKDSIMNGFQQFESSRKKIKWPQSQSLEGSLMELSCRHVLLVAHLDHMFHSLLQPLRDIWH
jgi:hypothetical protein